MNVEILSIGTEILMGELVDTNAPFLAARMPALGLTVRGIAQVGDSVEDLAEALARALQRSDVVITTGGLGPTQDDLTREAIARLLKEELQLDEALVEGLRSLFAGRGATMTPANLRQAYRIPSAQALPNRQGTAPGLWVQKDGKLIIALPGPPHEMQGLWEQEVLPRLQQRPQDAVIVTRTLKTFGLGELAIDAAIHGLFGQENPYLGIYAKADGVHLRIIARAATPAEAQRLIAPMEAEIRQALESYLWGVDDETPETRVGALLREHHLTLATMESLTGGALASSITDVQGSSDYFKGGFVAYTAAMKIAHGVPPELIQVHGVVSAPVAEAMAEAARMRAEADVGLGITGVAGPASLEGRPPGMAFLGLSFQGRTRSVEGRYIRGRPLVKRAATVHALLELYRFVTEQVAAQR
ncbi:MAG: competence/damage-inducible protein A [Dehalococcoidia bacterium]|nr:competence/damage-inducible protein A [Dehalococcoidia bacterium]